MQCEEPPGQVVFFRLLFGVCYSGFSYDRSKSSAVLYLEETLELDISKVTLVAGAYGHTGLEVEQGQLEATVSTGGGLHGYVLTSMADQTPVGRSQSVTLTLKAV
jgi:hypothetical protein